MEPKEESLLFSSVLKRAISRNPEILDSRGVLAAKRFIGNVVAVVSSDGFKPPGELICAFGARYQVLLLAKRANKISSMISFHRRDEQIIARMSFGGDNDFILVIDAFFSLRTGQFVILVLDD